MQSRLQSLIESSANTAIGFVIALIAQVFITHTMAISTSFAQDFQITCFFTVISIARSYVVRRAFNALHGRAPC